jgi:hypothetical protein
MYFDPNHRWTRHRPAEMRFSPDWEPNITEDLRTTTNVGAFVEYQFRGNSIRWIGRKFDDAGRAEVRLDGKVLAVVDQFDPVRDTPFRHELSDLPEGPHTIRITLLDEKNAASKDRRINLAGLDVICPPFTNRVTSQSH